MTTAAVDKEVLNFRKEHGIKKVTYSVLSGITEKSGYTIILFNSYNNNANVSRLCNALNIGNELLMSRGFTYSKGEFRLVFVNDTLSEKEKTIVLSHELGHIVLGHAGRAPVIGHDVQEEFEANEFAAFLMKSDSRSFVLFNCHKAVVFGIGAAFIVLCIAVGVLLTEKPSVPSASETGVTAVIGETESSDRIPQLSADDFGDTELYSTIKMMAEANLSTISPTVTYDAENHLIDIVCIPPDGTYYALMNDKAEIQKGWNDLCDNLNGVSDETYKLCLSQGYKVGCKVMLVGDSDPDVCLFAAMNGMVYCNIGT